MKFCMLLKQEEVKNETIKKKKISENNNKLNRLFCAFISFSLFFISTTRILIIFHFFSINYYLTIQIQKYHPYYYIPLFFSSVFYYYYHLLFYFIVHNLNHIAVISFIITRQNQLLIDFTKTSAHFLYFRTSNITLLFFLFFLV